MSASPAGRRMAGLLSFATLATVLALLHSWRDLDYSNYSEGVYALTSRLLLNGEDLYGDVVVAQPPVMFLVGATLLAIEDSIAWLRLGMGAVQGLTAALAAVAVWRLTGRSWAAALTAPIAMLMPWTVHEHGLLTPELVGAPLLVGGALLAARPEGTQVAAVLLSLAVFTKLPFAIPALFVAVCAIERRRCLTWLAAAVVFQIGLWTVVFGPSIWSDVLLAQQGTGLHTLKRAADFASQGAWNLLGLMIPAAAAVLLRAGRVRDHALWATSLGLAAGLLITLLTIVKSGTGINVVVPVESALLILAMSGLVWASEVVRKRPILASVAVAGGLLTAAQTTALLVAPDNPRPFTRPDSSGGFGPVLETEEVEAKVERARRCDPGLAYSGPPYLAFLAERPMPAGQPDGFLTDHSSRLDDVQARALADVPLCPDPEQVEF